MRPLATSLERELVAAAAQAASDCAEAVQRYAAGSGDPGPASSTGDARIETVAACRDASVLLTAVAEMLRRPFRQSRAFVLRRAVEAGLTAATECAADCERWRAAPPDVAACLRACLRAADVLRSLLRALATDDELARLSG